MWTSNGVGMPGENVIGSLQIFTVSRKEKGGCWNFPGYPINGNR